MHHKSRITPFTLGLSALVVPEDCRLAVEGEEEELEEEVDWDLLGCCRKALMVGCVPLLPLL